MNVKEGEGERAQAGGGVRYNAFCITNRMINHTICIITTRKNEFSHMFALVAPTSGRCRLQRFLEELVLLLKTHAAEREREGQLLSIMLKNIAVHTWTSSIRTAFHFTIPMR